MWISRPPQCSRIWKEQEIEAILTQVILSWSDPSNWSWTCSVCLRCWFWDADFWTCSQGQVCNFTHWSHKKFVLKLATFYINLDNNSGFSIWHLWYINILTYLQIFLRGICAVFCFAMKKPDLKWLMMETHIILIYLSGERLIKCRILENPRDTAAVFNFLTEKGRYQWFSTNFLDSNS